MIRLEYEAAILRAVYVFILLSAISFARPDASYSGTIYKWVDENGVTHFSDTITERAILEKEEVEVRIVPEDPGDSDLSESLEPSQPSDEATTDDIKNGNSTSEPNDTEAGKGPPGAPKISSESAGSVDKQQSSENKKAVKKPSFRNGALKIIEFRAGPRFRKRGARVKWVVRGVGAEASRLKKSSATRRHRAKIESPKSRSPATDTRQRVQEKRAEMERRSLRKNSKIRETGSSIVQTNRSRGGIGFQRETTGYSQRKPYLGSDDPHRPAYRRHPAARGREPSRVESRPRYGRRKRMPPSRSSQRRRGYSQRKPYLGSDDPHRPAYRRHPAARR